MKENQRRRAVTRWAEWAAECRSRLLKSIQYVSKEKERICILMIVGIAMGVNIMAQSIPVRDRFNPGEITYYDLYFKWGVIMSHAGNASISMQSTTYASKPGYFYRLLFNTSGLFEKVYKMRDTIDNYYSSNMQLLFSQKRVNENDYYLVDDLTFSYGNNRVYAHSHRYTLEKTKIDTMLVSSKQYMFDMLASTLYLRSLEWDNMQVGDTFPFNVAIGRDRVNIRFRYAGQQVVERSETLKYRTHHFYVDIFDDAFTQSKSAAELWIGDDDNHLPVKIRAKLKIGAVEVYYRNAGGLRYPLTSRVNIPKKR